MREEKMEKRSCTYWRLVFFQGTDFHEETRIVEPKNAKEFLNTMKTYIRYEEKSITN